MAQQSDKEKQPPQSQKRPGSGLKMDPPPKTDPVPKGDKMKDKVLFITGGDSGIGSITICTTRCRYLVCISRRT